MSPGHGVDDSRPIAEAVRTVALEDQRRQRRRVRTAVTFVINALTEAFIGLGRRQLHAQELARVRREQFRSAAVLHRAVDEQTDDAKVVEFHAEIRPHGPFDPIRHLLDKTLLDETVVFQRHVNLFAAIQPARFPPTQPGFGQTVNDQAHVEDAHDHADSGPTGRIRATEGGVTHREHDQHDAYQDVIRDVEGNGGFGVGSAGLLIPVEGLIVGHVQEEHDRQVIEADDEDHSFHKGRGEEEQDHGCQDRG